MALQGRFRVEVTTRFTPAGWVAPDLPPVAARPRLTETAVAFGLAGPDLDAEIASVRAKRSELAAYEAGLVERKAALGAQHPLPLPGSRGAEGSAADDFLPDELAVLLRCSVTSARYLVDHALVLVRQLPVVWRALADGRIDEARTRVICEVLRWQAASVGGPHGDDGIDELAARAVDWAERGCPPTTLRERLQAGLVAMDPEAAERRRTARVDAGDVTTAPSGDGTSELRATGVTTERAAVMRAQLTAYARKLKADGDPRPLGALRNAVLDALITRPWDSPDPAVAHVTITADLRDLFDPDQLSALRDLVDADTPADEAPTPRSAQDRITEAPGDGPGLTGGVGVADGQPVTPVAMRELLRRIDALGLVAPAAGDLAVTLTDRGRTLAVASPAELAAVARSGTGLGPPASTAAYTPTAAQYRYLRARDRHCRFPGCRRTALACDADHVVPFDHDDPAAGGPTCVTKLALLCRHHHRLKTHAPGWAFRLDPDGTLHVTTPGGTSLTTRPPGIDHVLDLLEPPPPPHDRVADPPPF